MMPQTTLTDYVGTETPVGSNRAGTSEAVPDGGLDVLEKIPKGWSLKRVSSGEAVFETPEGGEIEVAVDDLRSVLEDGPAEAGQSTSSVEVTFNGPTSREPLPPVETADLPGGVDSRELVGTGVSADDYDLGVFISPGGRYYVDESPTYGVEDELEVAGVSGAVFDTDSEGEDEETPDGPPHPPVDHRDDGEPIVDDDWVGEYLYTSWGYGQTNSTFAKIVGVSGSGRSVEAKLTRADVDSRSRGTETIVPTGETYGEAFRLYVREYDRGVSFRGSYPFIDGDPEQGTRRDSFLPYTGDGIYQTPSNRGH